ncbi:unnamed protein product [Absidia cylindrospora]
MVIAAPAKPLEEVHIIPLTKNVHFKKNAANAVSKVRSKYVSFLDQIKAIDLEQSNDKGSVNMTNEDDIEYYGTVKVGTPGQALKLIFDTGSSDLWFSSSLCLLCGSHTKYNPWKSSTYSAGISPWKIQYGDGSSAQGIVAKDTVEIGGLVVKNQAIQLAVHESASFLKGVTDGILGLGFSNLASVKGTITPVDNMIKQKVIKKPIFSVYLGKKSLGGGGEYVFGGSNPAHYQGNLTSVPVDNSKGFWNVKVASLSAGTSSSSSLFGPFEAIVDTGTTLLILQKDIAKHVAKHYNAKENVNDGTFIIDCDGSKLDPLQFSLGGSTFQIPGKDLVYAKDGNKCIASFATGDFQFSILGDAFIRNNYVVFDMGVPQVQLAPVKP